MKKILPFVICVLLSVGFTFFYLNSKEVKIGYVNASKLFDGYKMTDDLKKDLDKIEQEKKSRLDSLGEYINSYELNVKKDPAVFDGLKKQYMMRSEKYSNELNQIRDSYSAKVWKQLNEHSIEFGKEKKYQIILGANGQGTMMYAEDEFDLTDELIEYSNEKYEGKKKD